MTETREPHLHSRHLPDDVTIRHWIAVYATFLLVTGVPLIVMISSQPWTWAQWTGKLSGMSWSQRFEQIAADFAGSAPGVKLLGFAIYASLCSTFIPLPTGWVVAGVATREAAVVGDGLWATVLLVAAVGALASTIANLNDYHLFTWMLRHHRIARVRETKTHQAAERWFAKAPFFLLVVFNIIPIPVDFVRVVATTYRYSRVPFAGANFLGRFIRYGVIAFVTYWWNLGGLAVVVLLGFAAVMGAVRVAMAVRKKVFASQSKPGRV